MIKYGRIFKIFLFISSTFPEQHPNFPFVPFLSFVRFDSKEKKGLDNSKVNPRRRKFHFFNGMERERKKMLETNLCQLFLADVVSFG